MNKYQSYLTLLGFISEQCKGEKDKEWMLTEALENLFTPNEPVDNYREPLITNKILEDDMK